MNLRLNDTGMERFTEFVEALKNNGKTTVPTDLLSSPETSSPTGNEVDFEDRSFISRYECGAHVVEKLSGIESRLFVDDAGFWSALALLWFDQLCPKNKNGDRKPAMRYNYILSTDYRHYPRHAIRTSWQLVSQHGSNARFLLGKEMSVRGELVEQFMARRYLLSCNGVVGAANRLYLDRETGSFKRGAGSRKGAGCISRYITWLQQMARTHDLYSISAEDLYEFLPAEFSRFKENQS